MMSTLIFQTDSANANAAEDGADTRSGSLMDAGEVHVSTDETSYM